MSVELVHDLDKEAQGGVEPESQIYNNELLAWARSFYPTCVFCDGSIAVMESKLLVTLMPTSDLRMPSCTLLSWWNVLLT